MHLILEFSILEQGGLKWAVVSGLAIGWWSRTSIVSRSEAKSVQIEPKVIEVLAFMAGRPGDVLSQKEIIKGVWPDTYVSGEVLTYSIWELRKAFGDDAKNPHVIQTIPRRGYRLIAPVVNFSGLHASDQPSVAVLAFSDMSPAQDQGYFCDGIAEEIIHNLARLKDLRVVSRSSAFSFKGKHEDVRVIGTKLGVASVLEGSVRKIESRLRVTVQLINVSDGCHLFSERYDREISDVFAIQDEIARSIAASLKVTLTPLESDALAKSHTSDLQAFDYYLRGRQFYYQYKRKGIEFALKMFSKAIELDSEYARAYAGIADCSSWLFLNAGNHEENRVQADSASRKAIELDSGSAEAFAARGVALSLQGGEFDEIRSAFERAIRLGPWLYEAYYFFARVSFSRGDAQKAIELYEKACEVHPQDYQAPLLMAQIYSDLGRDADAAASRLRGIKLAEERIKSYPEDTRALYMGANGLVALGEINKGLEWARQALELDPDEPMVIYNVACIQSLAGRIDQAIDLLEKAVRSGLMHKGWIEHDSNLDPLRTHRRYKPLMALFEDPVHHC
jgi:adenylate cyclase